MASWLLRVDEVLRHRRCATDDLRSGSTVLLLSLMIVLFGTLYGAVMGSFGGLAADRLLQVFFSAVKVPLLLLATFAISLPSFYVLNMLFGLASDFRSAVRALVATQAGLTIVLASLAPYTVLWYVSFRDYSSAVLVNAVMFGVASLAGQGLLRQYYRPLIQRDPKHRWMLWLWILVYALVGVQMAWILRPFVGTPGMPPEFFRAGSWTNAYLVVGRLLWQSLLP